MRTSSWLTSFMISHSSSTENKEYLCSQKLENREASEVWRNLLSWELERLRLQGRYPS